MSNQPPPDPPQPYHPPQPHGRPHPDDAAQVSGQPWSTPSGDPLADRPGPRPPQPGNPAQPLGTAPRPPGTAAQPSHPAFQPGYASLPRPGQGTAYPPTSQFRAPPGYAPQPEYGPPAEYGTLPGYDAPPPYDPVQPDFAPPPPPPRKSNAPLIAVILAVTLLLCGGAVTAGVLIVNDVTARAKEAVEPITDPTVPNLPTEVPDLPTDLPDLPTDLPGLPTDLPTDIPGLPGGGKKISVVYEVTGDGPAEIVYTEKLGESPKRVRDDKLPWKRKTSMEGATLVSVTAIRSSADSGTISCRVTVDGEEVAHHTREGTFATVSCSKMVLN